MRYIQNLFVAASPLFCSNTVPHYINVREQPVDCKCRQVCDPDRILTASETRSILDAMDSVERRTLRCEEETISLRMRVFVEGELPNNSGHSQNATMRRADSLRTALDKPYKKSACGETTLLIYVKKQDSNMVISKGNAVDHVELSSLALENTEYFLDRGFYASAVQSATLDLIRSLDSIRHEEDSLNPNQNISTANSTDGDPLPDSQFVVGHHDDSESLRKEEETGPRYLGGFARIITITIMVFALCACCVYGCGGMEFHRALKDIDRGDRDIQVLGATRPASCPRCLKEFDFSEGVISLDCCHTFCESCSEDLNRCGICGAQSKLLNVPVYHETRCIMCLEDYLTSESSALTDTRKKLGSDGKLLKILPCGHTMDQTCFDMHGEQLTSCPYCSGPISILQSESKKQEEPAYEQERIYRIRNLARRFPVSCTKETKERWLKSDDLRGRLYDDSRGKI